MLRPRFSIFHFDDRYQHFVWPNSSVERVPYAKTISIDCSVDFDDYWQTRSKKLRDNIRRYFRRAENSGYDVQVRQIESASDIRNVIDTYAKIESAGWKGRQGTAIGAEGVQRRFYEHLLSSYASVGGALCFELLIDGDVVASRLAIKEAGIVVFLKTTYKEEYSKYAVGRLLLYKALECIFKDDSNKVVEFYTNASVDQQQWATHDRMIYHIDIYAYALMRKTIQLIRRIRSSVVSH